MPEPAGLALAAAILAVAAATQGFFGFGFGIIAMTGLTLSADVVHAAGVVNVTGIALTGSLVLSLRRGVLWPVMARLLPPLLLGVAVGVLALGALDRAVLVRLLGATVVAIAAWNLVSPRLQHTESRAQDLVAGLLAGLLGGAFNTGGPPLVAHLYRRGEAPETLKATVQALFFTIGLSRLPIAASQGLMGASVWRDALLALPLVLAGSYTGLTLARRLPPERFRRAGWIGLGALGVALLVTG
jgi:uncharacterized membrane protein YfcA